MFSDPRQRALHVDNVVGPGVTRRHLVFSDTHTQPRAARWLINGYA